MGRRMSITETMENKVVLNYQDNWRQILSIEKALVESNFNWIKLQIGNGVLIGGGELQTPQSSYFIKVIYSPFLPLRFDRIFIKNKNIKYNKNIHLYRDMSLCLYHPIFDKPFNKIIPLSKMIPWISEWCIHYEEWKKYKVWLGKEILHV